MAEKYRVVEVFKCPATLTVLPRRCKYLSKHEIRRWLGEFSEVIRNIREDLEHSPPGEYEFYFYEPATEVNYIVKVEKIRW